MAVRQKHIKLGDWLIQEGIIQQGDLERCLQIQRERPEQLGQILLREKLVTEEHLLQAFASQMGFSYIHLHQENVQNEALQLIKEHFAKRYMILPIRLERDILVIATSDPLNISINDDLMLLTGYRIRMVVAARKEIEWGIDRYYLPRKEGIPQFNAESQKKKMPEYQEGIEDLQSPAHSLVQTILNKAIARRASDIHIESHEVECVVRFRIDGKLHDVMGIPEEWRNAVISRLKIMANLRITEKRKPQDGGFHTRVDEQLIDIRMSTLPTMYGEKIVLRLLQKEVYYSLSQLGFQLQNLALIRQAIASPHGMILITGPTGSGKTSTLYSILQELNAPDKNIVTIEDPVEYVLPRINQIQVQPRAGLTFASGLRSILRQDPDVIMIGEIRDEETAKMAVQAALTGHLVLSTLHTNTAIGSYSRLLHMGVEPYLLAASLKAVIAQRLVRRICPSCKQEVHITNEAIEIMGIKRLEKERGPFYAGNGCFVCQETGYQGRLAIQEIVYFDKKLSSMISGGATEHEMEVTVRRNGVPTLLDDGVQKVIDGHTTIQELLRVVSI